MAMKGINSKFFTVFLSHSPGIVSKDEWEKFIPYQITLDKIKLGSKNCIVNPCPPFTRGHEVTDEIITSEHFIGYKAKESLLHMQKAILASLVR